MAWNPLKNDIFFQRVRNVAHDFQASREEIARLADIWTAENVNASPDFVDALNMSKGDISAMISLAQAFQNFMENRVVTTANRVDTIAPVLASGPAA